MMQQLLLSLAPPADPIPAAAREIRLTAATESLDEAVAAGGLWVWGVVVVHWVLVGCWLVNRY